MRITQNQLILWMAIACGVMLVLPLVPLNLLALVISYIILVQHLINRPNPINSIYWIWFPWAFAIAPLVFSVITYFDPAVSIAAIGHILLCLALSSCGYLLVVPKTSKAAMAENGIRVRASIVTHQKLIDVVALLGVLGSVMFFLEMFLITGVDLANLFALRNAYQTREVTILSQIAPMIAWGGWVSLSAAIIGAAQISRIRKYLWICCGLSVAVLSIMSAGRQTIFLMTIIAMMAILYSSVVESTRFEKREKTDGPNLGLLTVIAAAVTYMFLIAVLRVDVTNTNSKSAYLFIIFNIEPDWDVYEFMSRSLGRATDAFYETIVYFSSGLSSLSGFLTGDPSAPHMGKMTFPWIARRLSFLSEVSPEQALAQLALFNEEVGAMPVGWSTAFGIYIWDFGFVGSLIVLILSGIFSGFAWRLHMKQGNIFSLMIIFFVNINFFYLLIVPATSDTMVFFFLLGNLTIVALIQSRFFRKKRAKKLMSSHEAILDRI